MEKRKAGGSRLKRKNAQEVEEKGKRLRIQRKKKAAKTGRRKSKGQKDEEAIKRWEKFEKADGKGRRLRIQRKKKAAKQGRRKSKGQKDEEIIKGGRRLRKQMVRGEGEGYKTIKAAKQKQ